MMVINPAQSDIIIFILSRGEQESFKFKILKFEDWSDDTMIAVMHAGSFFVNRRRRAQNGSAWRRFGGVERNFIKIYVLISRPKKL